MEYKLYKQPRTDNIIAVYRLSDMACIPFDPANTDAKEFAKWLAEGGVPEAAVEGETVSAEWIAETIAKLLPAENT
jgi:hypothetical protein